MFERFTDPARLAVVRAQDESRALRHAYIGTEHLLLGLLDADGRVAIEALGSLGVTPDAVRARVLEIIGEGRKAVSGHIPFTPRAKKVLELSLREAQQLDHGYIGPEHLLLGLIREGQGVAAQVLTKMGADADAARREVVRLLTTPGPSGGDPEGESGEQGADPAV
jgi:ATP-dependent Clp protease ATP-binding subunit ClpC